MSTSHPRRLRTAVSSLLLTVASAALTTMPAHAAAGAAADASAYSFTARIDVGEERSCSGALVAPTWVLTATSCFTADGSETVASGAPAVKTTVVVGRGSTTSTAGKTSTVSQLQPYWDRNLVLAKLATPVTGITPVALASSVPAEGEALSVLGYGRTATEWRPDKAHSASYVASAPSATSVELAGATADESVCKGDTGGPVIRTVGGAPQLVAISSKSWQGGCLGTDDAETRNGALATLVNNVTVPAPDTTGNVAHVMAIGSDNKVYGADGNYTDVTWTAFKKAADNTTKQIATTTTNGVQRLFAVSDTGQLLSASSNYVTGPWSKLTPVSGGENIAKITAVGIGNVVHLYAIKTDGKLYGADMNYSTNTWKGFGYISGGDSLSEVSATAVGNTVRLFVIGVNGTAFHISGDYTAGSWNSWASVPGTGNGHTQVVATAIGNDVHVYILRGDDVIWGVDDAAGTWSAFKKIPGNSSIKRIAVTDTGNTVHLFAIAGNNDIYNANGNYTTGTWGAFNNVPGNSGIKDIAVSSTS